MEQTGRGIWEGTEPPLLIPSHAAPYNAFLAPMVMHAAPDNKRCPRTAIAGRHLKALSRHRPERRTPRGASEWQQKAARDIRSASRGLCLCVCVCLPVCVCVPERLPSKLRHAARRHQINTIIPGSTERRRRNISRLSRLLSVQCVGILKREATLRARFFFVVGLWGRLPDETCTALALIKWRHLIGNINRLGTDTAQTWHTTSPSEGVYAHSGIPHRHQSLCILEILHRQE